MPPMGASFWVITTYSGVSKINGQLQYMYDLVCILEYQKKYEKLYTNTCMSRVMRKPAFCICENKDADQLRSNRTADQHLCFHYIDTCCTNPLLPKSEISSSVAVQPSLCWSWLETPKTGFLATQLILCEHFRMKRRTL